MARLLNNLRSIVCLIPLTLGAACLQLVVTIALLACPTPAAQQWSKFAGSCFIGGSLIRFFALIGGRSEREPIPVVNRIGAALQWLSVLMAVWILLVVSGAIG